MHTNIFMLAPTCHNIWFKCTKKVCTINVHYQLLMNKNLDSVTASTMCVATF